ncbi:hypothetical protein KKD70_02465, partial [Patescibacteria group bacterium]|nr:hypothetical protein [Patescibacteria group bacterium]
FYSLPVYMARNFSTPEGASTPEVKTPVEVEREKKQAKENMEKDIKEAFTSARTDNLPKIEATKHANLDQEVYNSIIKDYNKDFEDLAKSAKQTYANKTFGSLEEINIFKAELKRTLTLEAGKLKSQAEAKIKEAFLKQQHEVFKKKIEEVAETSKVNFLKNIYDSNVFNEKQLSNINQSDLTNLISIYVNHWKKANLALDIDENSAYAIDTTIRDFDKTHFAKDLKIASNIIEAIAAKWAEGSSEVNRKIFSVRNWEDMDRLPDFPGGKENEIKKEIKNKYDKDGVWLNEEGKKIYIYPDYRGKIELSKYSVGKFAEMVGKELTATTPGTPSQAPKDNPVEAEAMTYADEITKEEEEFMTPVEPPQSLAPEANNPIVESTSNNENLATLKTEIVELEKQVTAAGLQKANVEKTIPKVLDPLNFHLQYRDGLKNRLSILNDAKFNLKEGTVTVGGKIIKLDTDIGVQFTSGQKDIKDLPDVAKLASVIAASKIKILMQNGLDEDVAKVIANNHTKEVNSINNYVNQFEEKDRPIIVITGTASLEGAPYKVNENLARERAMRLYSKMKNQDAYKGFRIETRGVVIGANGEEVKDDVSGWKEAAAKYKQVVGKEISTQALKNKFFYYNGENTKGLTPQEKEFAKTAFDQARHVTMRLVIPEETQVAMTKLVDQKKNSNVSV